MQPRLQPIHWRLLETPDRIAARHIYNETSLFLSSSMIRKLETRPIPSWSENATANSEDQQPLFGDVLLASSNNRVKREDISAALSKNITRILEELLKDYDKTERPEFSKGQLITVWKCQDFCISLILREINFRDSRSAKSAIFPH